MAEKGQVPAGLQADLQRVRKQRDSALASHETAAGQIARLESALSRATGKRVQAKVVTDPALMGGLVAKIGDTVFDGSVKSRFSDVREQWG